MDTSTNINFENLLTAARNAKETQDETTAIKHYETISSIDPNNWEAFFYLVALKTKSIKLGEVDTAAISVSNCLPKVFQLIKETISDENERKNAVQEVVLECNKISDFLYNCNYNLYSYCINNDVSLNAIVLASRMDHKRRLRYESANRCVKIGNLMCICGNAIETIFGLNDSFYASYAVFCWEKMLNIHFSHIKQVNVAVFNNESINMFYNKVKRFKPNFELPKIKATEKRNYTILGIALVIGVIVAIVLYRLYINYIIFG